MSSPANSGSAADGRPTAFGQPIQGQPIAGVAVPAHAMAVAGAVPGYPTDYSAAGPGAASVVTVQGQVVSATDIAGPASMPTATATAVPSSYTPSYTR